MENDNIKNKLLKVLLEGLTAPSSVAKAGVKAGAKVAEKVKDSTAMGMTSPVELLKAIKAYMKERKEQLESEAQLKEMLGEGPPKVDRKASGSVGMYQGGDRPNDIIFNASNDVDEEAMAGPRPMGLPEPGKIRAEDGSQVPPSFYGGGLLNVGTDDQGMIKRRTELMKSLRPMKPMMRKRRLEDIKAMEQRGRIGPGIPGGQSAESMRLMEERGKAGPNAGTTTPLR